MENRYQAANAMKPLDTPTIILMRHGRPALPESGWIAPSGMRQWIDQYNHSEVLADGVPDYCLKLAASVSCIASSTAPRALSSVRVLGRDVDVVDSLFGEAALPTATWHAPHLPALLWAAWFRMLWFLGYAQDSESIHAARYRADAAAQKLVALAESGGTVLLVGHGIMNRLIGNALSVRGWMSSIVTDNGYWSYKIYRINNNGRGLA